MANKYTKMLDEMDLEELVKLICALRKDKRVAGASKLEIDRRSNVQKVTCDHCGKVYDARIDDSGTCYKCKIQIRNEEIRARRKKFYAEHKERVKQAGMVIE